MPKLDLTEISFFNIDYNVVDVAFKVFAGPTTRALVPAAYANPAPADAAAPPAVDAAAVLCVVAVLAYVACVAACVDVVSACAVLLLVSLLPLFLTFVSFCLRLCFKRLCNMFLFVVMLVYPLLILECLH
jgi:hypothetical protein